jgi:hypothetical protein
MEFGNRVGFRLRESGFRIIEEDLFRLSRQYKERTDEAISVYKAENYHVSENPPSPRPHPLKGEQD